MKLIEVLGLKLYSKTITMCGTGTKTNSQTNGIEELINKYSNLWTINLWQRIWTHEVEEEKPHQQTLLGKLDCHVQINKTGSMAYTSYKSYNPVDLWTIFSLAS